MAALGLIETKGLLAAVEGADAMVKTADVRLLERHLVGGGLVTITVAGEVSAVRAAVDAAVAAIGRIPGAALVSERVIARPDDELARILALDVVQTPPVAPAPAQPAPVAPVASAASAAPVAQDIAHISEEPAPAAIGAPVLPDRAQLKKMSLRALRQLALSLTGLSLSPDAVATADKKGLMEAIINAYRQREE